VKQIIESDQVGDIGIELCREEKRHPTGLSVMIWSAWLIAPNGKRLGISNDDQADEQSMRRIYMTKVNELRSQQT
jgi:hypothetical protein